VRLTGGGKKGKNTGHQGQQDQKTCTRYQGKRGETLVGFCREGRKARQPKTCKGKRGNVGKGRCEVKSTKGTSSRKRVNGSTRREKGEDLTHETGAGRGLDLFGVLKK